MAIPRAVSRPFLTAEWRRLALVTFPVPDDVLAPHLPPGTEPDRWDGSALVSLVAFEFLKTRIFGVPVIGFRDFPEWNLRFYVREKSGGRRRGVAFVRELVPSRVVAAVARGLYDEPYLAVRYRCLDRPLGTSRAIEHAVTVDGRTHRFRFVAGGEPEAPPPGSLAHFLKEQEWGFGTKRDGVRVAYRVEHPVWRVYPETRVDLEADCGALYGAKWSFLNDAAPLSRLVAEGSAVTVHTRETAV